MMINIEPMHSAAMFDLLHSSTNKELFEIKVATMKNTDDFSLRIGSHHVQPPN